MANKHPLLYTLLQAQIVRPNVSWTKCPIPICGIGLSGLRGLSGYSMLNIMKVKGSSVRLVDEKWHRLLGDASQRSHDKWQAVELGPLQSQCNATLVLMVRLQGSVAAPDAALKNNHFRILSLSWDFGLVQQHLCMNYWKVHFQSSSSLIHCQKGWKV